MSGIEEELKAAVRSWAEATPADIERITELVRTLEALREAEGDEGAVESDEPARAVVVHDGPVVAGLRLRRREFSGWVRNEDGSNGGPVGFEMWEVVDDLVSLLRMMMEDETQRQERRMPYFGIVWPSGASLVNRMLNGPRLTGKRVLDLGCGLGECGFAAAALGAKVTFFDWEPRAIAIVKASADLQDAPRSRFSFVVGDWRKPPARLGSYDLILGGDLLYEQSSPDAVAAFISRHLRPGAEAWMTDPGRPQAWLFIRRAMDRELEILRRDQLAPQPGARDIALLRVRRTFVGVRGRM